MFNQKYKNIYKTQRNMKINWNNPNHSQVLEPLNRLFGTKWDSVHIELGQYFYHHLLLYHYPESSTEDTMPIVLLQLIDELEPDWVERYDNIDDDGDITQQSTEKLFNELFHTAIEALLEDISTPTPALIKQQEELNPESPKYYHL